MKRVTEFVHSHKGFAVNLASLRGEPSGGPTATITVAFQGHYSRFVDMAAGH